jgi:hypothetical protein
MIGKCHEYLLYCRQENVKCVLLLIRILEIDINILGPVYGVAYGRSINDVIQTMGLFGCWVPKSPSLGCPATMVSEVLGARNQKSATRE